ncbi:putative glycosyltransferase [Corynebacterium uterequi]|uniref:Putative glycosyltransferase n=1 Tax=Corynebacterium uterequi TaxID=1072256 RepID=A0A0G3HG87_9CORY|nr:glycosyltransferase family 2 protein [Corynebacterium uterequi]AKK10122.1 putative glycosyltransferase [Corynebacterium uterequi]
MPLESTASVAAVIVTHQRVELLRASLTQVVGQTRPVQWVIVVDNDADPAVAALLDELAGDRGVYLPSHTNLGGAGGFAYGFLHALALGADAVWCADDDGRPGDLDTLEVLLAEAVARSLDEISPLVCSIDDPSRTAFPVRQGVSWLRSVDEFEGDFVESYASLFNGALISTKAMEVIGVPDYRLFIRGDEVDYHNRMARAKLRYGTTLKARYLHPEGVSEFHPIMGGRAHAQYPEGEFKRFFTYRNRGFVLSQPGYRTMIFQEIARFGWFFLLQRRSPREFFRWLSLLRRGRNQDFRRP